jgi:hypothetical protein
MKRLIVITICLSVLLLGGCLFDNASDKTLVTLSFTAPQQGQQISAGQPFNCTGTFKCSPANVNISKVYVWLVLVASQQPQQDLYYVQTPVTLSKNGAWNASLTFQEDTTRVIAIHADADTDKLFKSWLAQGTPAPLKELPKTTQFLGWVDVKF